MASYRVGVIMDPIDRIKPKKDTSLALMLEAQRRGCELHYMEQSDLLMRDGEVFANRRLVEVSDDPKHWFAFTGEVYGPLAELDVILMRKDPPVDAEYLYTTYLLERVEHAGALVVNRPQALREVNEKLYTAWFGQCTPPTLVTSSGRHIREFLDEHGDIIVKPLDMMGGASVFRLREGDPNVGVIIEVMTQHQTRSIMAQRYIPDIAHGDKRILMVDGEPVAYALARIPAAGETRGNLAAGGRGEGRELGDHDRWIAEQVGPTLRAKGLLFVGLDVIGDYLTEINVTSPTCARELDAIYGINIAGQVFDAIERRLAER
ncbi:MAG: glutathione synthase [Immundisolibacter sp.]|uniref:glutathione synthase n=1 Tax=Immundisolibacter sp. TaxID=1934948 RepID=UPI003EDEE653